MKLLVTGDSIIKSIEVHLINGLPDHNVVFKPYPGSRIEGLTEKVSADKCHYDLVLVHVGTNNVESDGVGTILRKFEHLFAEILSVNPDVQVIVSGILSRSRNNFETNSWARACFLENLPYLNDKIDLINYRLESFCLGEGFTFYFSPNPILGWDGLHLGKRGHEKLGKEFVDLINQVQQQQVEQLAPSMYDSHFPALVKPATSRCQGPVQMPVEARKPAPMVKVAEKPGETPKVKARQATEKEMSLKTVATPKEPASNVKVPGKPKETPKEPAPKVKAKQATEKDLKVVKKHETPVKNKAPVQLPVEAPKEPVQEEKAKQATKVEIKLKPVETPKEPAPEVKVPGKPKETPKEPAPKVKAKQATEKDIQVVKKHETPVKNKAPVQMLVEIPKEPEQREIAQQADETEKLVEERETPVPNKESVKEVKPLEADDLVVMYNVSAFNYFSILCNNDQSESLNIQSTVPNVTEHSGGGPKFKYLRHCLECKKDYPSKTSFHNHLRKCKDLHSQQCPMIKQNSCTSVAVIYPRTCTDCSKTYLHMKPSA